MATKPVPKDTADLAMAPGDLTTASVLSIIKGGGKIRLKESDGQQQSFDMLAAKLESADPADLLSDKSGEVTKPADIIDRAFQLVSVDFRNSDLDAYPDSIGIFAVLHARFGSGTETIVAGGNDVVLKAMRLVELGALPRYVRITESTSNAGRSVHNLVDATSQSDDAF